MLYNREVKEYLHAKREAARRQGTHHLPSNAEVREQLLLIAQKVDGDEHPRRLREMRELALGLMELLEPFHPRLIGSVLTGHIRKGSDIDLHAHTEDVEGLCGALEVAGHSPVVEVVRTRKYGEPRDFTHVRLSDLQGYEAEITVYPPDALHVTPRCGITGGPMPRASAAQVRRLLEDEAPVPRSPGPPVLTLPLDVDEVARLVPELLACRGVLQNSYHHLDVFEHTMAVVAGLDRMVAEGFERFGARAADLGRHLERSTLLLLAGLCHDLGKPATQSFARDGRIRFPGHDRLGADMARAIGPRIGLDPQSTDDLARLVECHLEAVRIPSEDALPSRIHRLCARVGERLPELALLSLADVEAARGPAQSGARLEEHERFVDFLLAQYFEDGFLIRPVLPATADDLAEELGVTGRGEQARLLEPLMDAFVDGEVESREECLALASELMAAPGWRG